MSVMLSLLRRRHGATLGRRDGRLLAAHYGSPATEIAVCRVAVGLAERSDRATLEVRGRREELDRALGELAGLGDRAWWSRLSRTRVVVRCEHDDRDACLRALGRDAIVSVHEPGAEIAALALVGPYAEAVLAAAGLETDPGTAVILRDRSAAIELLVARRLGPALWTRLLDAGEPYPIACVGVDAIAALAASQRRIGAAPGAQRSAALA